MAIESSSVKLEAAIAASLSQTLKNIVWLKLHRLETLLRKAGDDRGRLHWQTNENRSFTKTIVKITIVFVSKKFNLLKKFHRTTPTFKQRIDDHTATEPCAQMRLNLSGRALRTSQPLRGRVDKLWTTKTVDHNLPTTLASRPHGTLQQIFFCFLKNKKNKNYV